MAIWEDFIDSIVDPAGRLAKAELKGLIRDFRKDRSAFLARQGRKMQRCITQLAKGEITPAEFRSYIEDIRDLTEMEKVRMSVAGKARAQRLIEGITDLVINGLLRLI
jgi:hypothetical protein